MKLIKQVALVFTEGRSEKVYEVDLCEVGANQFVVNFRYGKRGAALKDGSKTVAPVGRAEADRVFDKLVSTKVEQGYLHAGAPRPERPAPAPQAVAAPPPPPGSVPAGQDPRAHKILERLAATGAERRWFRREGQQSTWKLERAIWRAGELKIREAEPLLLALVGTAQQGSPIEAGGKGMRDYCVAWALGFCGSSASVSTLGKLYGDSRATDAVRRIAGEALLKLSDEQTRLEFKADMIEQLPEALREKAKGGSPGELTAALAAQLRGGDGSVEVLEKLYLIDSETVRPAVLAAIEAPFKPPLFQRVRHIFKAAEYRRDAEMFGRIAYRFEKQRASAQGWEERRRGLPHAFGRTTRMYLRRRVWRTLRRLGQAGDPAYVPMAVGVLLPFTDGDAVAVRTSGYRERIHWDRFAPYWAFNHILYGQSPRYQPSPSGKAWRCKAPYQPGGRAPDVREESFPGLWQQNPAGLMHLCAESACTPVHEFAARALSGNRPFCDGLELDDVVMLLSRPYEPTARLGFEIAQRRYDASRVDTALLLAVARSAYGPGREQAFKWIDAQRVDVLADSSFLAALVLAPHDDTRAFARRLLRSSSLGAAVGQALLGRLIAAMLALNSDDATIAADAAQTIVTALGPHLGSVSVAVIRDLVAHPLAGVQELGAELLLRHDSRTGLIPEDLILGILHSSHEAVRAAGMRLIAELPDEVLVAVDRLLLRLVTDRNADIRNASRPIVKRIASTQPEAAEFLAQQLVESLLRRLLAEDVPTHVLRVLREDLLAGLANLPRETVWRLLSSGSPHAQELGGVLLATHLDASDLEIDQIAKLASHEILSVRQASWSMYEKSIPRIQEHMAEAVKILDAKWQDSRDWAFRFFRERFPPEAFTVEVVTTIIDSIREDVQAFGREMVQRSFKEEEGPALLRRLSEHPARSVQLFTTNYLERYASTGPEPDPSQLEKLETLMPYFSGVLSRVNQGRIAKSRVLAFLRAEGMRSEEAAKVVVGLLHRLSATIAIEDRGAALEAMVAIHHAHPGVALPLRFKPAALRARAASTGAR